VHISRCAGGLRLSGFSSWCVMAMSGELAQHGVGDEQDRGVARSKYVGWTDMASAERELITGVWGGATPLPLPLQKLVEFVSISGATSSKSGVDMFTPVHPATGDGHHHCRRRRVAYSHGQERRRRHESHHQTVHHAGRTPYVWAQNVLQFLFLSRVLMFSTFLTF